LCTVSVFTYVANSQGILPPSVCKTNIMVFESFSHHSSNNKNLLTWKYNNCLPIICIIFASALLGGNMNNGSTVNRSKLTCFLSFFWFQRTLDLNYSASDIKHIKSHPLFLFWNWVTSLNFEWQTNNQSCEEYPSPLLAAIQR